MAASPKGWFKTYIRYPLEAVVAMVVFSFFKALGVDRASNLGAFLIKSIAPYLKQHRLAKDNLVKAFPDKTAEEIEKIIMGMWDNLGRTFAEFVHAPDLIKHPEGRIEFVGLENLIALRDDGKAGLFLSAHLANWELNAAAAYAGKMPLHRIYRAANNPFVEKMIYSSGRGDDVGELLPKGAQGAKRALELLKKGEHLGILCDQKMNDGIELNFFGRPAMTAPAPAQFALKYKCPIVMSRIERLEGAHFRVTLFPPIEAIDTGNRSEDIMRLSQSINLIIESWIREKPEQWLWAHNRWK